MVVDMLQMDPHSLGLPVVEGAMQLEFLAADQRVLLNFVSLKNHYLNHSLSHP